MKRNKKQPVVIGITGGVGSGKSRLSSFAARNYKIRRILADEVGRELMAPGKSVYEAIVSAFGRGILGKDGCLDKKKLSGICFGDPNGQEKLNRIEHPLIREEILKRISRTKLPFVLLEAALLKEGKLTEDCDEVLFVYTDREVRIERLMKSRGYSREKCEKIIGLQLSDAEFRESSTLEIDNSCEFDKTLISFERLLKKLGVPKR